MTDLGRMIWELGINMNRVAREQLDTEDRCRYCGEAGDCSVTCDGPECVARDEREQDERVEYERYE